MRLLAFIGYTVIFLFTITNAAKSLDDNNTYTTLVIVNRKMTV